MSKKFKLGLSILLFSVSAIASAQNQYKNKVVVIPLFGDESTWQGPWQVGITYNKADIIEEGGSSYIAVKTHAADLSNIPPDAAFWEIVAASGASGGSGIKGDAGEKGEKGDAGDQGLKGDTGAIGATGIQGPKGDSGATGSTGLIGPQGLKGDQGNVGVAGPQGLKGDQGNVGAAGPQGMKGDQGDVGVAGPQGLKGDQGDVGSAGPQGSKGDQGDVGAAGPQGMKGDQGDVGVAGPQGMKGDQGDVGVAGPQGMKGDQGIQGERGLTGIGMQGPMGAAGAAGADGSQFPPDGTTTFEKVPDAMKPDEKVISGISYSAANAISITTPDAMKPDEKVISGITYTAGANMSITGTAAAKVVSFVPSSLPAKDNYQPSLGVNYIIALQGFFPSRSSADPFIAEIIMFGGNFAPRGWAFCEGQLLPIAQNSALFSLLGTVYGGDGRTTFALPDLRGRTAIQPGTGPGLPNVRLGQRFGSSTIQH